MKNAASRAFSLLELLVVVGIIVILISIAIPVISKVRQSAYAASTQSQMATLAAAIERYQGDFRAYPGPLGNDAINNAPFFGSVVVGIANVALGADNSSGEPANTEITGAENLVLGLLGGLMPDSSMNPPFVFDPSLVGKGPSNLNSANPRRYAPYLEAGQGWITQLGQRFIDQAGRVASDTEIPEFIDQFPSEPLPILYLRARVGANGVVGRIYDGSRRQYDLDQITGYTGEIPPGTNTWIGLPTGERHHLVDVGDGSDFDAFDNGYAYLRHPSLGGTTNDNGTPRQKDGYILISAGKDRIYGTADDIANFGSVR